MHVRVAASFRLGASIRVVDLRLYVYRYNYPTRIVRWRHLRHGKETTSKGQNVSALVEWLANSIIIIIIIRYITASEWTQLYGGKKAGTIVYIPRMYIH